MGLARAWEFIKCTCTIANLQRPNIMTFHAFYIFGHDGFHKKVESRTGFARDFSLHVYSYRRFIPMHKASFMSTTLVP